MKIGLLYPSSNAHPSIGLQFIDGLRKCLQSTGLAEATTILSDGIGFGGAEKEVYQKAEKLLIVENVDVLIAYLDLKTIPVLEPLIFASGKLMIVVNVGANYPQNWAAQPNIIYLTLQHSFLCWLNGYRAAQNINKNGLLASTFYDCGYLQSAATVKKFVGAGGNITFNYINNQAYDNNFHINELITFLSTSESDTKNLLCVFDTKPAKLFYNELKQLEASKDLNLFVSPMMLEDDALNNLKQTFPFSIKGYIPWDASATNNTNTDFYNHCKQQANYTTNSFTLQGWETALVLQQVFLLGKENNSDVSTINEALLNRPINSPRGILNLDIETNYYTAPFINCTIETNSTEIKKTLVTDFQKEWEDFTTLLVEGVSSGWSNTYLCY